MFLKVASISPLRRHCKLACPSKLLCGCRPKSPVISPRKRTAGRALCTFATNLTATAASASSPEWRLSCPCHAPIADRLVTLLSVNDGCSLEWSQHHFAVAHVFKPVVNSHRDCVFAGLQSIYRELIRLLFSVADSSFRSDQQPLTAVHTVLRSLNI